MPPSTATQRRDVALDRLDRVERDAGVGDERAAGLEQQPLAGPEQLVRGAARSRRRSRSIDGGCWSRGVGDAEAAAEVVDGEVAERRRAPRRAAPERRRASSSCEPMCMCRPDELERARRRAAARSRRARRRSRSRTSSRPGRSRSSSCVSPATPGVTRISTAWRTPRSAAICSSRSISSKLSSTIVPDAGVERLAQLGVATWRCRAGRSARGRSPPRSARCSSPPEATSHASPSSASRR